MGHFQLNLQILTFTEEQHIEMYQVSVLVSDSLVIYWHYAIHETADIQHSYGAYIDGAFDKICNIFLI